ncbi:MAG: hypothetical protein CM15mP32_1550 [Flavobacteriaceae bacterium]|nr:MAG: hypothetical protein CM15mP32_1550 [Flavobacteriaceae bacterium]
MQEIYCQQATTIKLLKAYATANDGDLVLYTWNNQMAKSILAFLCTRACTSSSRILSRMKLTIGPAIDQGFYYDIDPGGHIVTEKDFDAIEKRMIEVSREQHAL